jgi:NhaP-type Na+/H+ and K+/H+ antiporter
MKNTMNRINKHCIALAALGVLLTGCITHRSVVYQDVERVKVEFESDAAARLFYETLSRNSAAGRHSESTTTISIPIVFENEQKVVPGRNAEFNEAVAICDSNKDGKITEAEARIYANQH